MAYTDKNFKTKKEFKLAVAAYNTISLDGQRQGRAVKYFQPGGMFPVSQNGPVTIEGPHYPQPHTWYASCVAKDGVIVSVK
jgi:hypothetical protein